MFMKNNYIFQNRNNEKNGFVVFFQVSLMSDLMED